MYKHKFTNPMGYTTDIVGSGQPARKCVVFDVTINRPGTHATVCNDLTIEQAAALRDSLSAAIEEAAPVEPLFRKGQQVSFGGKENDANPQVWRVAQDCLPGDTLVKIEGHGDHALIVDCGESSPYVVQAVTTWERA